METTIHLLVMFQISKQIPNQHSQPYVINL